MALTVVAWLSAVTLVLIVAVVTQLVVVRCLNAAHRRRREAFESIWLPIMVNSRERGREGLPPVARRDVVSFLTIWNRVQDSVVGDFREPLNQMAFHLGMDSVAHHMLAHGTVSERLLAIATVGRLRDRRAWAELLELTTKPDLVFSLTAARALLRIDPRAAVERLLPLIAVRDDWSASAVERMLLEAGADAISAPLAEAALRAAPEQAHRVIRYLGLAYSEAAFPVIRTLLVQRADHGECVTACLRLFTDADDLTAVLGYLTDRRWQVRVRAVEALGRVGTGEDHARLVPLLSDPEWWVRYRAAQALCALPTADPELLEHLSSTHGDPFARDILAHALAERRFA